MSYKNIVSLLYMWYIQRNEQYCKELEGGLGIYHIIMVGGHENQKVLL